MTDFTVAVAADFSEILNGFKQLPAQAQTAGDGIAKGLDNGLDAANKKIGELLQEIKRLTAEKASLSIDSNEYKKAQEQIKELGKEIGELQRKKVTLTSDVNSINALIARLGDLRSEFNKVEIGSQRFKELQKAVQDTEKELRKAGESGSQGMKVFDAALSGVAFSLTNTVTNALGAAVSSINQAVSGFATLDTEIRKAAGAAGEEGAYENLAASIDKVGIDAAGTQMEVAQLVTSLVRGGMTVNEVSDSLMAIVRGAEATGTAYERMGQIVSSSIKSFGLAASDATRVVDALVQGANASATGVSELGEAFKYAAPVARITGISIEGLTQAVGLFANAGIPAEMAGVTLRNGLTKLAQAAPSTTGAMQNLTGQSAIAATAIKELGINVYNSDGTLKPMTQTLLALKAAFDKLEPASKLNLAGRVFGGDDDGAKWLSLLNLTQDEIRNMGAEMEKAKGATDRNRDAMQGFEMLMKQLTGTLDSFRNTLGGVAVTAFTPLINLANSAIGAIAGLPDPIKKTAAALSIVTVAAIAATAAIVLFQRAMEVTYVQVAAAEIRTLAMTMATTLSGAIQSLIAVIPGLITQLSLIGGLGVRAAIVGLASVLRTTLLDAVGAAAKGVGNLIAYMTSTSFLSFINGVRSTIIALAPLAAAIAAVTGAIIAFQFVLSGTEEGAATFKDAQTEAGKAAAAVASSIKKAGDEAKANRIPVIGFFQDAKEQMAQLAAAQGFTALQDTFTKIQNPALAYFNLLKSGTSVTEEQSTQALKFADSLKKIASTARDTAQSLLTKADAAERAGDTKLAAQYRLEASALENEANASGSLAVALTNQAARAAEAGQSTQQQTLLSNEQKKAVEERTKAEEALNKVIAEAPVRRLDAQLAVGQQLLSLAKGISELEQSRFGVIKAANEYELKQAQERKASEQEIKAIKDRGIEIERQALEAKFRALMQQQQLENSILMITQQKARIEADLSVKQQEIEILKAKKDLNDAIKNNDQFAINAAQAQVNLQEEILGVTKEKAGLLSETQPLERAIAAATAETARNGLLSQITSEGFAIAADGTLRSMKGVVGAVEGVATITTTSADEAARYAALAGEIGLNVTKAKDGTIVLGTEQGKVQAQAEMINKHLDGAGKSAGAMATAFATTGSNAAPVAKGAEAFAGSLGDATGYARNIAALNLPGAFTKVAGSTRDAAAAAKDFYGWLQQAAQLPGSRWTGGPVEAGAEYRINELGQEAFLSAGRLSLIDAAPNAIWRAPSDGVVIPAGITARLQNQAAPVVAASPAGVAELAVEVGKLRGAVDELRAKSWDVNVTMKTGINGSQILSQIHRMR